MHIYSVVTQEAGLTQFQCYIPLVLSSSLSFCLKQQKRFCDELILAGKLQLKKLQEMKAEKIQASTGLEPMPPRY